MSGRAGIRLGASSGTERGDFDGRIGGSPLSDSCMINKGNELAISVFCKTLIVKGIIFRINKTMGLWISVERI
jgi:hypothetical protein